MKAKIIEAAAVPEKKYPYLGVSQKTGMIVLFCSSISGVVIRPAEDYSIGDYNTYWNESNFTPFTGTIQLSND
jgi:hypothetical protein